MPRWSREVWVRDHAGSDVGLLRVTCCLFWTWPLPEEIALEMYKLIAYHPTLVRAAREAAAPLGPSYAAMHVRRGDKAVVDKAYAAVFGGKMTTEFFGQLAKDEGFVNGATVFVATDELERSWFKPLAQLGGYKLVFVDDLAQPPLVLALSAFPQKLWADVLAILEQIVCAEAPGGFVGSLPSTLSGHIINVRRAQHPTDTRPLFTKVHETCCDARTEMDLLKLPGVASLADVPCHPHKGNPWC